MLVYHGMVEHLLTDEMKDKTIEFGNRIERSARRMNKDGTRIIIDKKGEPNESYGIQNN